MLLNYLKLSIRLLTRNPFFAVINVAGLAIAFAAFYALWGYATAELKSDQYHKDFERIARICVNWQWTDDGGKTWGHIVIGYNKSSVTAPLKEDFPQIESTLRIQSETNFTPESVGHERRVMISLWGDGQKKVFKENKVVYADSNLFEFFSIPILYGDPSNALAEANLIMLSKSTAVKYFGKIDPRGKLLALNDSITLTVSGVYEDLPSNTHLEFDMVISNKAHFTHWQNSYWNSTDTYVKLREGSSLEKFSEAMNKRTPVYWAQQLRVFPNVRVDMFAQPLSEIAFGENLIGDSFLSKSKTMLITLIFIACSVLFMAWINYINLSITLITRRLKEVAARKVTGAVRRDLVMQFVVEAAVTSVLALCLAFTLIQLVTRSMSLVFNIAVTPLLQQDYLTALIFGGTVFAGIAISGIYAAAISGGFPAHIVFRPGTALSRRRVVPSVLTVAQLTVAVVFILLSFVVYFQLNHVLTMDTGVDRENVIVIDAPAVRPKNYLDIFESMRIRVMSVKGIVSASGTSAVMGDGSSADTHLRRLGSAHFFGMDANGVDEDFIRTFGLQLQAGRNFVKDDRPDVVIISRYAAQRLGFDKPEDAVGAKVETRHGDLAGWTEAEVVGLVEDFRVAPYLNMQAASSEYDSKGRGIFFVYGSKLFSKLLVDRLSIKVDGNATDVVEAVKKIYDETFPGNAFSWGFLDDHVNQVYHNEKIARNQVALFSGLAIFIACLGLLGMTSYRAIEKTKEIGVRKVLGARASSIAALLVSNTSRHVLIAVVVGMPIAYYLVQLYLKKYSTHIELQWWHFLLPMLVLMTILITTIAAVLIKAMNTKPVEALKYE